MNIKRSNKLTLYQIGILRALSESDKPCNGILLTIEQSNSAKQTIQKVSFYLPNSSNLSSACSYAPHTRSPVLVLFIPVGGDCFNSIQDQFILRLLHADALVTYQTTALRIPLLRISKAQLASLLLLFCTLAIATRCYATATSVPKSVSGLARPLSPIRNSKARSSSLTLSRLILPHFVQNKHALRFRRVVGRTSSTNLVAEDPLVEVNLVGEKGFRGSRPFGNRDGVQIGENYSDVVSVTGNFTRVLTEKLNYSIPEVGRLDKQLFQEQDRRLMPPGENQDNYSSLDKWGVVVSIIVSSVALTVTLGLITCILSHYRAGTAAQSEGTASDPNNAALTPTSAPMLSVVSAGATAGVGGMERLRGGRTSARDLAAAREQQVRLHALRTDLAVNLPPSIAMPDGEDHPYSNARIHIRDAEQEAEIYQKCIRPPPNRTVLESESPPPYRSSSAGLLGSSSSSSSSADWTLGGSSNAPLVERCHSMSSTHRRPDAAGTSNQKTDLLQRTVKIFTGKKTTPQAPSPAPTLPVVVVPSRRRDQNPTAHRPSKGGV